MNELKIRSALLTRKEIAWLLGNEKVSKIYEYRIKSDIKKKKDFNGIRITFTR